MLQTERYERSSSNCSCLSIPVALLRDFQRTNFIDATDATGWYQREIVTLCSYEHALESLAQTVYRGTGGECIWASAQGLLAASGAYIVVQNPPPSTPTDPAAIALTDVGRQLAFARHYLSLSASDLSKTLLVERPTIYAWLDGKWEPKHENRGRIRKLYQVARAWRDMSKLPVGRLLREPVDSDACLMEYLVRDTIELATINRVLGVLRGLAERQEKAKRVRSVREIAKQRGFKPLSSAQEQEAFDRLTRF